MTNVIRYYLVINNTEVTHLRADFSYQLGGYNMFTGRYEARGYYMGVVPVKITDDGDWITESFLCSSGKKKCILEVARKSQRKSDEAFVYFDASINDFIMNYFDEFEVYLGEYVTR